MSHLSCISATLLDSESDSAMYTESLDAVFIPNLDVYTAEEGCHVFSDINRRLA